ncbi:MAG: hypothetical protein CMC35_03260 [Flavobacteriaceae bacterium]|nr:hypothetical protein [Flavobacteriaceae bacterium]
MSVSTMITQLCFLICVSVSAQHFNQRITAADASEKLLGPINKEALSSTPFSAWFVSEEATYAPDDNIVSSLQPNLSEYTITAFMGTWCGDSKREVPRFYKILEAAEFPLDRLQMIALDNEREAYKQSPGGEEEGIGIHRVPTFIIYKDHHEVGRIVEHPKTSLEADLLAIISSEPYEPNYPEVTFLMEQLKKQGIQSLISNSEKLVPKLASLTEDIRGLLTYSSVLLYSEEHEAALAVATLATKVFPKQYYAYVNLGNKLQYVGKKNDSIKAYEKALELRPDDESLQETIASLKNNSAH